MDGELAPAAGTPAPPMAAAMAPAVSSKVTTAGILRLLMGTSPPTRG